jgi:type IV pilus assembly protein PilC
VSRADAHARWSDARGSARATGTRARISAAHLTAAIRQFASLLNAGLPLTAALDVLEGSSPRPALRRLLAMIRHDVTQGLALSRALARHPHGFSEQHCALVAVAETSGTLAAVLQRIADERSLAATQRAKLRAALTYPVCLLAFGLAIVAVLTHWVIPTFEDIFASFDARLPPATRIVINVAHGIAAGLPYALAGIAATSGVYVIVIRRSRRWRMLAAAWMLATPVVGALVSRRCIARWCRALGTLLGAGVPLADALDMLSRTSGHPSFDKATADASTRIRRGERLSGALAHGALFPATVVGPIAVAEQSGALDTLLIDLANLADHDVQMQIDVMLNLIEPALVALLGVLIGGIVLTLYLPIIELGQVM